MKNLQGQLDNIVDLVKKKWKPILVIVELAILLIAGISYFRQVHNLIRYEYKGDRLKQYTREEYASCFSGEIDESYNAGLYDVIPKEEMFLKKGYYIYTVNYESASPDSFCWPHTYEKYYDLVEQAVTYLEDGNHENTEGFWVNADLHVALRFYYSGTGNARVTGFVIEETSAAANIKLFSVVVFLLALDLVLGGGGL